MKTYLKSSWKYFKNIFLKLNDKQTNVMTTTLRGDQYGFDVEGHTQVILSGLPELASEEGGGRVLITHMCDIKESAVEDNLIDENVHAKLYYVKVKICHLCYLQYIHMI